MCVELVKASAGIKSTGKYINDSIYNRAQPIYQLADIIVDISWWKLFGQVGDQVQKMVLILELWNLEISV